jgi:preprotein translocase subunit SecG
MLSILLIINAVICVALIILILLQRTDPSAGGMFGGTGGAGGPVIRNPLAKPTAYLAGLFLLLSLVMAYFAKGQGGAAEHSVMAEAASEPTLPPASFVGGDASVTVVAPAALVDSATPTAVQVLSSSAPTPVTSQ